MKALRTIITEIAEYQQAMGYKFDSMTPEERMNALRDYTVALMVEQSEMLEEVSWKPWRTYESQKPNPKQRKIALEWIDCLFFLVNQSFCLNLSVDDILEAYETKLKANNQRIISGYSKLQTADTAKRQ